jgi:dTDP-4-dehydrorhamnose reductase
MLDSPRKILLTGASGQLGDAIMHGLRGNTGFELLAPSLDQLDLHYNEQLDSFLGRHRPQMIINCAAYTAVDKAEQEQEQADQLNHVIVERMARYCTEASAPLIHISTDYVFDGSSSTPYLESDETAPLNIYGKTKLAGEQAIERLAPPGMILRTSWLYSASGHNFINTIRRLAEQRSQLDIVFDQVGTPTWANDLAQAIIQMLRHPRLRDSSEHLGIFHFSNEGLCSWYDLAQVVVEHLDIDCDLRPVRSTAFPTPATRPSFTVLDKSLIKEQFDLRIRHWQSALFNCLNSGK